MEVTIVTSHRTSSKSQSKSQSITQSKMKKSTNNTTNAPTTKDVCLFFMKAMSPLANNEEYKCTMCGCERKQAQNSGWSNLQSHLQTSHPGYEEEYKKSKEENKTQKWYMKKQASEKAKLIWSWLDWIIMENIPFEFVESDRVRKYSSLGNTCVPTLTNYIHKLHAKVVGIIEAKLKKAKTFGLQFDGWTKDSNHYLGIFATYAEQSIKPDVADIVHTYLLSCNVQSDVDEQTEYVDGIEDADKRFGLSAADLYDHIQEILVDQYNFDLTPDTFNTVIEFLAGDNCNVNRSLADQLEVPLVGCCSHRLQLAVKDYLGPEEKKVDGVITQIASPAQTVISNLDKLMGELTTLKNAAVLRSALRRLGMSPIKPERRCKAKWASLFNMLKKWEKLKTVVTINDTTFPLTVRQLIPSLEDNVLLETITADLESFESVSKLLQGDNERRINLFDARFQFDNLIRDYQKRDRLLPHLHQYGTIVNNPFFESGIIKIQGNLEHKLNEEDGAEEKEAVAMYLKPQAIRANNVTATDTSAKPLTYAQKNFEAGVAAKKARIAESNYKSTAHIPAANNICERLFSVARLNLPYLRSRLDPDTLDALLFLKANYSLWNNATIIDEILNEENINNSDVIEITTSA